MSSAAARRAFFAILGATAFAAEAPPDGECAPYTRQAPGNVVTNLDAEPVRQAPAAITTNLCETVS